MPEELTQPIIQPTEIPNPTPVVQKKSNPLLILALVFLFLGIVVGAVYLGMKIQERGGLQEVLFPPGPAVNYNSPTFAPTSVPTAIPTIDETANWTSYTNDQYGYLLKYPQTWKLINDPRSEGLQITFQAPSGELIHATVFSPPIQAGEDNQNGGVNHSFNLLNGKTLFVSFVECDGPSCGNGKKEINTYNQILSTFKLIK